MTSHNILSFLGISWPSPPPLSSFSSSFPLLFFLSSFSSSFSSFSFFSFSFDLCCISSLLWIPFCCGHAVDFSFFFFCKRLFLLHFCFSIFLSFFAISSFPSNSTTCALYASLSENSLFQSDSTKRNFLCFHPAVDVPLPSLSHSL